MGEIRDFKPGGRRKAAGRPPPSIDGPPPIRLINGELPRIAEEAERRLIEADLGVYQRTGLLVRAVTEKFKISGGQTAAGPRIVKIDAPFLRERLGRASAFEKYDGRVKAWLPADAPMSVVDVVMSKTGLWNVPPLVALTNAPTLRPDGTVITEPGYDPETGILFIDEGEKFPVISRSPPFGEAQSALHKLLSLVQDFPFVDHVDRSVWASSVLCAVSRYALGAIPMHAITASAAGSGKSMLSEIPAIISTGRPAPVLAQGVKDEELEKRVVGAILAGDRLLLLDNCDRPIGGDLLCQMITQKALKLRVMGTSNVPDLPGEIFLIANGNNLQILGDLARRAVMCRLDAGMERPELRRFTVDPLAIALRDRAEFLTLALTILRGFYAANCPAHGLPPIGGFPGWCRVVRGALIWLGEPDPAISMEAIREADPILEIRRALAHQWRREFGSEPKTLRDVVARCLSGASEGLKDAVVGVAGDRGTIDIKRLAGLMRKIKGRIIDGLIFQQCGDINKVALWRVMEAKP